MDIPLPLFKNLSFKGFDTRFLQTEGEGFGIFYLPGFENDLTHAKTARLFDFCQREKIPFTVPEWLGFGSTSGADIPEGATNLWLEQALEVLDKCTTGPQILLGFSMGGWLMLALAQARPERVQALVGFAAGMGDSLCELHQKNYGNSAIEISDIPASRVYFTMSKEANIINAPLSIDCPISLMHAYDDARVNWRSSLSIVEQNKFDDVDIHMTKIGGHRFVEEDYLQWAFERILYYRRENILYDTFDENGSFKAVATRKDIHTKGLWHQSIHCWLLDQQDDPEIYLHELPPWHPIYPNKITPAVTGHVSLSETPLQNCVRKLKDDHGIVLPEGNIIPIEKLHHSDQNGKYVDNELLEVFYTRAPVAYDYRNIRQLSSTGVFKLPLSALKSLFSVEKSDLLVNGAILKDGNIIPTEKILGRGDFLPFPNNYYLSTIDKITAKLAKESL